MLTLPPGHLHSIHSELVIVTTSMVHGTWRLATCQLTKLAACSFAHTGLFTYEAAGLCFSLCVFMSHGQKWTQ